MPDKAVMDGCSSMADIENSEFKRRFEVAVEDGGMTAYARVYYRFDDNEDMAHDGEQEAAKTVKDEENSRPYTVHEAMDILKSKGIVNGIIIENLKSAIEEGSGELIEVARGTAPIDGTDDMIIAKYDADAGKKLVEVNERVDFYSIGRIISVNPGDLVAEKLPGTDGRAGTDVSGRIIKQRSGRRLKFIAGRGVKISEDGLYAYAEVVGRPEIKDSMVSVYEVYEVQKDVDVSTGNIEFAGDVFIRGNVLEGMKVSAGGNVTVLGSITDGKITAGASISVGKNIIGSILYAGCTDIVKSRIIDHLEEFKKAFSDIFSAVIALKETGKVPKTYKDGQIIKVLLDTKFNKLYGRVKDFRSIISDNRSYLNNSTIMLGAQIIRYFSGNGPLLMNSAAELKSLEEIAEENIISLKGQIKQPSKIDANYVQNSTLESSGDINISGKGCYNSNLYCRGSILFKRPGSVMRGGTISAGRDVKLYELGSPGGAQTSVSTGKDSCITCEIAHTNCVIKVGNMSSKLEASYRKVRAYLHKGEIILEKSNF